MQDLRPWIGEPPHHQPPVLVGYQLHSHERFNMTTASLVGLPLLIGWLVLFPLIVSLAGGDGGVEVQIAGFPDLIRLAVQFMIVFVVTLVVHEAIHGIVAAIQGARPAFGIGPGFAYTTIKEPLSRNGYLAVVIAPGIVISLACFALSLTWPGSFGWWLAISALNASGLGGDLWMLLRLRRAPRFAQVVDLADGYALYLPTSTRHTS